MRSDMHKVIVEEPRHGAHWNKKKRRKNQPYDLLPKYQGMRRPYKRRKWFGEHLGPLKRWLRSNVGRPWNDVYSEACQVIKPDNVVRAHIRTHMLEYVERNTFMRDGEVWCFRHSTQTPIRSLSGHTVWPKFYVHPETGILHEVPHRKVVDPRRALNTNPNEIRKWISDHILLLKIHSIWYSLEVETFKNATEMPPFDALFRLRLCKSHAWDAYGKAVYCVRKRQLSRAELKRHSLVNSATPSGIHAMLGLNTLQRMKRSNGNPVRARLERQNALFSRRARTERSECSTFRRVDEGYRS